MRPKTPQNYIPLLNSDIKVSRDYAYRVLEERLRQMNDIDTATQQAVNDIYGMAELYDTHRLMLVKG